MTLASHCASFGSDNGLAAMRLNLLTPFMLNLLTYIYVIRPQWVLIHWGRVTHICVSNLTIIGPDNGLSPGRRQAIIWTNAGILLIGPWGTNFSEILIDIHTFSFKKIHLKMSSAKWRPFCLGLNVLRSNYQCPTNITPFCQKVRGFNHPGYHDICTWFCHDDVIKWKHFPRHWPFVRGIHRPRWIPHTKASDAELWCFLWSASE